VSALGARALVFFASASVLLLEILAGRLLAPYVGVSLETFTAIIGTVLAGIAMGSWWGGRMADRHPPMRLLGPLLIAGGILSMAAPSVVAALGPGFAGRDQLGIVILTSLGFLAPAIVLSAVSPIVVKLRLQTLEETGSVVGQLSAVSTAGALFGTFVTGFVLLAAWPSRPIVLVVGGALLLVGTAITVKAGRWSAAAAGVVAILAASAGVLALAVPGPCEYETPYVCAQVLDDDARSGGRALVLDTVRHSYVDLDDPTHLEFRYIKLIADVIDSQKPDVPLRTLYIGGGGFTVPTWLEATRPESTHTVLEIDPVLVDIAESRLGLDASTIDDVLVGDARISIAETAPGAFDVVVGDAFSGSSVPWHLTTKEFLELVDSRMASDGLYVMNVIDYPPHEFVKAEVATLADVFEVIMVIAPEGYLYGNGGGNYIVVASHEALAPQALVSLLRSRDANSVVLTDTALADWYGVAPVLIDDFAPVDQLLGHPS